VKHRYFNHQAVALLLIVFVMLVSACRSESGPTPEEKKAIKAVMEKRAIAIHNKDIELYKDVFISDYDDMGSNYQMIIEEMTENFERHEVIEFTYRRSPIDFKMNSARMVGNVSYKTDTMEKPVFDHEVTLLRRVEGKWYISGGVALGLF